MATLPAVQRADARKDFARQARVELGAILGPVPRYLFQTLDESNLAYEIQKRWVARRMEMSQRIIDDQRLLRFMDPEKVQDHWSDWWTNVPLKKLQHSHQLSTPVFNWSRAIVEALTGLLTGSDDVLAYNCNVMPWNKSDEAARVQAELVETFKDRWLVTNEYERIFMREGSNLYALGRNWKSVITQKGEHLGKWDRVPQVSNVYPGAVAAFWQDYETLEAVIVASEMLPGVAAAMYPDKADQIAAAVHSPSSWWKNLGAQQAFTTWDLNSTVGILTYWYRSTKGTIGQAVVLQDAPLQSNGRNGNIVLLKNDPDTGYPDIPYRCTPRFLTPDRPPDEAQGALYDVAPLNTQYDEVVGAARDMLWRAIYVRYKLTNAYGRPPALIPKTSILALRAGQDLQKLDDVLNSVPVDTFINRLEELMIVIPGLSRYFLGQAPPAETSGEAIHAAINASIQRQISTRTEVRIDERWMYQQIMGQWAKFGRWDENGESVSLEPVLKGDYNFVIRWSSDNPKDAVKAKQLALSALSAGVISLDTAQDTWGIVSTQDERRKILADRANPVLRPDIVALTEQALSAQQNRQWQAAQYAAGAPMGGPAQDQTGQARAASATVAGTMRPPLTEGDNDRGLPPAQAGDQRMP